MVDLVFKLAGREIPVAHARELNRAVVSRLPWLGEEPAAGIHLIHGAASSNGWLRPCGQTDALVLARRACLVLRLPVECMERANELVGARLQLDSHELCVGASKVRELRASRTLFARYVAGHSGEEEEGFIDRMVQELTARSLDFSKLLCGRSHEIQTQVAVIYTRSLMVAGVGTAASVALQEHGIGRGRLFGCGLFVPHKSIEAVSAAESG